MALQVCGSSGKSEAVALQGRAKMWLFRNVALQGRIKLWLFRAERSSGSSGQREVVTHREAVALQGRVKLYS